MITTIKNDKLLFFLKGKKYPYKHKNKCFYACIFALAALFVFVALVYGQLRYTYGRLDIWDLSARTTYKDGVDPIDDLAYFEEKTTTTNSDGDIIPEMQLNNRVLSLNPNGIEGVYLAWVYTGNERFEYDGNYQWNELIAIGKTFSYNTSYGYRTAYDTETLELSEDGWYTVFAIWYEDTRKLHVVKNVHVGSVETSGGGTEYEKEAYENWMENKRQAVAEPGVKNILFIGADHWDKSELTESYSDYMVLATINTQNQEVVFTTILKESYVYIPSIGCGRLTNAYNCGGVELVVRTIEENYGLKIDNYLLLDYNCFIQMINLVGGIEVYIEAYQAPYVNQYIDSLAHDYSLDSDLVKTDYLKEATGDVRLDGPQTLAYLRYYQEGDWARSARYEAVMKAFYDSVRKTKLSTIINGIFPLFTTDFSFDEYTELLYELPLYLKYDVRVHTLPGENRLAPFEESYRYSVLLNVPSEIDAVMADVLQNKNMQHGRQWWISPILVTVYIALVVLAVLFLCFILLRKRRVVYIDAKTGDQYYKNKKYRWNSEVHVYRQDVLGAYDGAMFMNRELTQRYSHKIKMPMHDLAVYVSMTPIDTDGSDRMPNEPAAGEASVTF